MDEGGIRIVCRYCQAEAQLSAVVAVVLLFAPGLARPYPLIPAEDYRVCLGCSQALPSLVTRAQAAHALTADAGAWTRALVICVDGRGYEVRDASAQAKLALA